MRAGLARVGAEDTRASGGLGGTLSPTGHAGVAMTHASPWLQCQCHTADGGRQAEGLQTPRGKNEDRLVRTLRLSGKYSQHRLRARSR